MQCSAIRPTISYAPSKRATALVCRAQQQQQQLSHRIANTVGAAVVAAGLLASPAAWAGEGVSFKTPVNNITIKSSALLHVEFVVEGMEVRPAADGLIDGTGHFHLMIDETQAFEEGRAIPFDDTHLHYGKGQVAADITLSPGVHKLTLQFANALHQSYGPKYASTITVKAQ